MANEDAAAQAAGEAARIEAENQTRAAIENVTQIANADLAAAQTAIDEANARAQQIAEAAMQTEIGRRLQQNEERDAQWRNQVETRLTETSSTMEKLSGLLANFSAPAPVSSSVPPISPENPVPVTVVQPQSQSAVVENPGPPTNPEPPRPRKIRL